MTLPHLDPNLVLWFSLASAVSNVVINSVLLYYYAGTIKAILAKVRV